MRALAHSVDVTSTALDGFLIDQQKNFCRSTVASVESTAFVLRFVATPLSWEMIPLDR